MEPVAPATDLDAIIDPRQFPVSISPMTTLQALIQACGDGRVHKDLIALWQQRLYCDHCGCNKAHGISIADNEIGNDRGTTVTIELVEFPAGLVAERHGANFRFSPEWSAHFHLERHGFRPVTLPEMLAFHANYSEKWEHGILEMGTPIPGLRNNYPVVSYINTDGVLTAFSYGSVQLPFDKYAAVRL